MEEERLPPVESPALEAFAALAAEFCSLVESHRTLGRDAFLRAVHLVLPKLYLAGVQLPPTAILFKDDEPVADAAVSDGPSADSKPNPDRLRSDAAAALCRSLSELIGQRDLYWNIFDPFELTTEPQCAGTLSDDFADIFRDIHDGLTKWRRGESGEALWEWRFGFEIHWGRHLVSALNALYVLNAAYESNWPRQT